MPEWLMGEDCKSSGSAYAGSNPARPKNKLANLFLKFASLIECILRKLNNINKKNPNERFLIHCFFLFLNKNKKKTSGKFYCS